MLYWSQLILEDELIRIRGELKALKQFQGSTSFESAKKTEAKPLTKNLLTVDPFDETLTTLLGPTFSPKGTLRQVMGEGAKDLHPFSGWAEVQALRSLATPSAGTNKFGIYESLAPQLARGMEIKESEGRPEIWVYLRDDIFWQPLRDEQFGGEITLAEHFQKPHPVTAHDFKFYVDAVMNPFLSSMLAVAQRGSFEKIEEMRVIDDKTFVIRWRSRPFDEEGKTVYKMPYSALFQTAGLQPLASFLYQYLPSGEKISDEEGEDLYRKSSLWAANFERHWAKGVIPSCGPWNFEEFTEKRALFSRNPRYFDPHAALTSERVYYKRGGPTAALQEFKAEGIDLTTVASQQVMEWKRFLESPAYLEQKERGNSASSIEYLYRAFSFIGWNQNNLLFKTAKTRRAMTLAIDRKRIIQAILGGMGVEVTAPIFIASSEYDKSITPLPFDPDEAKRLLEEEGWIDEDGDGIREKMINGKKERFSFSLSYYSKDERTRAVSEFIAGGLKTIGVECRLKGLDVNELGQESDEKSFDALYLSWGLGSPPSDFRQLWHSSGAHEKGSSNMVVFQNGEVDAIIDALDYEYNAEKRRELYFRFHQLMHEEQPYTFLYTPKVLLAYRDYLQNVFIPEERQDLIPGATVEEPQSTIFWIKKNG